MTHPIGYYASVTNGTADADILRKLEQQIGSFAENLSQVEQMAFLAVLATYLFYESIYHSHYNIKDATFDILPDSAGRISNIIQQLDGISPSNTLALIAFFTAQLNAKRLRR